MTSAQNAYLVTGTVTKVTTGTADLAVDKNTTYQHWDGFGGCFNEMGWDALSVLPADQVTSAIKQDGANQVGIITSTADRQAAVEFAKAAAMRPRIVGEALQEIGENPADLRDLGP